VLRFAYLLLFGFRKINNDPFSGTCSHTWAKALQTPHFSLPILIFTKFDSNPILCKLILKMYLIQVQICPEHSSLIPRPIFTKFDSNPTLCQPILKMFLILGSELSREAGAEPAIVTYRTLRVLFCIHLFEKHLSFTKMSHIIYICSMDFSTGLI